MKPMVVQLCFDQAGSGGDEVGDGGVRETGAAAVFEGPGVKSGEGGLAGV